MTFKAHGECLGRILGVLVITTALAACGDVSVGPNSSGSGDSVAAAAAGSGSSPDTTGTPMSTSAVALSSSTYTVAPSSSVVLTINRSGTSTGTTTVGYSTIDGTATAGADYVATSGSVTWGDGQSGAKTVSVPVTSAAGGMNFAFALTSVVGDANFGTPASALVEIAAAGATSSGSSSSGGATGSSNVPAAATASVFPHIGVQAFTGGQYFAPAHDAQLAQYGLVILGGNFPQWPAMEGRTRDQLVVSLKSQTHAGKNALTPIVFQYENANEMHLSNPWFPEWTAAVSRNNWFVYNSGAGGTKSVSAWDATMVLANPDHVVGTDQATGLYPYGLLARLLYQRYYLGTGSGGAAMASTHLDGYFVDNMMQRDLAGSPADWERNGTNPSETDPTATAAVTLGKADYPAELAALDANIIAGGNGEFGYDMSPANAGGLAMSFSNLSGKLGLTVQQFVWGTPGGQANVLNFGGFSGAMTWYETIENNTKPGGYVVMTGGVLPSDYQLVRYSLGLTLMRNGWALYAINAPGNQLVDLVDPSNTASYPVFDEFWGGTLNTAGYLGAALSTAQGAEQSAPWLQGVWRRDFANGIVLVNPNSNGAQSVQLGGTFWHLRGGQAPNVNNGSAVNSVTIPAGDGLILLRAAPP